MPIVTKISRPSVKRLARRARLLGRIDRALRACPVVWVSAPAGSGKTSLATSWAAARRRPCLWYRVDEGDADPATFFHYMREAVQRLARSPRSAAPPTTREWGSAAGHSARRLFEDIGAIVPPGTMLVLDDYQECAQSAPLHDLVAAGAAALPQHVAVLVLSRAVPPPPFARCLAHGAMEFIGGGELDLDVEETRALAKVVSGTEITMEEAARLHARTGGWLAGTVLLLEAARRALPPRAAEHTQEQQILFDYFGAELFDRLADEEKRVLLATALLPEVDAVAAQALAGECQATGVLAELVCRNAFTVRLPGERTRYRFHPLFREFLLARARRALGQDVWPAHVTRAAEVLAAAGRLDEAAAVLIGEGASFALARVVVAHAPGLARDGRLATVREWLRPIPEAMVRDDPWLSYWSGICSAAVPREARAHLLRAYRAFKARRDAQGALAAWVGCVGTYLNVWDEFQDLDPWIAEMDALEPSLRELSSPELEASVTFGMLATLMWRRSAHPDTERWAERAAALVSAQVPPELRMQLATYVVFYRVWWKGDHAGAASVVEEMRPLGSARDVTPLTRIVWCVVEATCEARLGNAAACFAAVDRGLAIARDTGITGLDHQLAVQGAYGALAVGDLDAARRYHDAARRHLGPEQRANEAHFCHVGAWIALCAGDIAEASAWAQRGLAPAAASGADAARPWLDATLGVIAVERGEAAEAIDLLNRSLAWGRETRNDLMQHHCLLALADAYLREGRRTEAVARLAGALEIGRARRLIHHPWTGWRRDVMARLAALALEHDVEVEHVTAYVVARGLTAPEGAALDRWPGAVRIRTLGGLELWRDRRRITFSTKVPRKPLELLQALVAEEPGSVPEQLLADALWPEMDGAAARKALETTLYRLRRILGDATLIARTGGSLRLDPARTWADVRALQLRIAAAGSALEAERIDREAVRRAATDVLDVYRGPPFPALEAAWAVQARERIRARVARVVRLAATRLSSAGDGEGSEALLHAAAGVDPTIFSGGTPS